MHCNYHFFKMLEKPLSDKLKGKTLLACFSQEKDELILGFGNQEGDFYIKCSVKSTFGGLYFSETFHRAKQNSVDLFEELIDLNVSKIFVFKNERAIAIELENDLALVLKMYGNRSNIIAFNGNDAFAIFNNRLKDDLQLKYADFAKELKQSKEAFLNHEGNPSKLFPTWGKLPKAYFEQNKEQNIEANWGLVESINELLKAGKFYIINFRNELHLSLLRFGEVINEYKDPFYAANSFYVEKQKTSQLENEKRSALKKLQKELKNAENYLSKTSQRLDTLLEGPGNQAIGHLIMAYLHEIPKESTLVTLNDFQTGKPLEIKLKKDLSAQKNAELYYRKAKKEKIEFEVLEKNLNSKEQEIETLKSQIETIEKTDSLKSLRNHVKKEEITQKKSKIPKAEDLFKVFEIEGYKIWIGKNAKNNDLLTLKYSHKNDTWLHAKDVSGSHVVIKEISGQKTPKRVLETAAGLAAWFSKKRNDTMVPVAYTPKKFVRKIKGTPDGAVMVEKEDVLLIEPIDPAILVEN
ncbi:hypothetical protein AFM12_01695 [Jiulongibacter sediminis]|uniref:NFACT RNA-binding domain-containing protein n=2 Tax=Jiulongibacter sediminis TaxID=1605367 RepID=A0A0P7BWN9_9BACT|nr:hypothetical protein AFM12_01695 [Jiulongibacter sediminis]TBX26410.1 hypothetical protein TK44_01700 [Jiulongibacter sediminis]